MSYSNRYSGAITITPPLTATEIRRAPRDDDAGDEWSAHLRINLREVDTDEGSATLCTADAIVGPEEPCSGYDVEQQIQALADLYADSHTLTGWIQVDWDPGFGSTPPSRYMLRDGRVVEVKAQYAWPEDGA